MRNNLRKWRNFFLIIVVALAIVVVWQFSPPPQATAPENFQPRIAVWMGVTWSMDAYSDEELQSLAGDLQAQGVDDAFVYVSYLTADDTFNATYEYAADFTRRMKHYAPEIRFFAWVGVPISITTPDRTVIENRLTDPVILQNIANFAGRTITEMGFDGFHLNAELIPNEDDAFLQTLDEIRQALPEDVILTTTAHALRLEGFVTLTPYPTQAHHSTPAYLRKISQRVDQVALMAYDSGLFTPADYRAWMAYQVQESAAVFVDSDTELLIGVPTSEEWTRSHQLQAESLDNALSGFGAGLDAVDEIGSISGIAIYPYWETDEEEWDALGQFVEGCDS